MVSGRFCLVCYRSELHRLGAGFYWLITEKRGDFLPFFVQKVVEARTSPTSKNKMGIIWATPLRFFFDEIWVMGRRGDSRIAQGRCGHRPLPFPLCHCEERSDVAIRNTL